MTSNGESTKGAPINLSFTGRNAFTGMNQSLQQMFTGSKRGQLRRKGRWDAESHSGDLWIWAGAFKRWKKRTFSAAQPGLLTFRSSQKKGKRVTGGSINLHDAILTRVPEDPRYFRIQTPSGGIFHLRTLDPEDLEPCIASVDASAASYKTMLGRAKLLAGNLGSTRSNLGPHGSGTVPASLHSLHVSLPLEVKINNEEPSMLKEVNERVSSRMEDLEPFFAEFEKHVKTVQESMSQLSKVLNLEPEAAPPSPLPLSSKRVESLRLSSLSKFKESQMESGLSVTRADSFQSAVSDLQRSPTSHMASTNDISGFAHQDKLSNAWRELRLAAEDGFHSEATRIVELQAENDALKASMRQFKLQAQKNARKLKALSPSSPGQRASSESDDDFPRLNSMEQTSSNEALERWLPSSVTAECREAMEALEAVQKHAFAVRSMHPEVPLDSGPYPPGPVDFEDAGSEEEAPSEPGSRQPSMTYELSHQPAPNVWEVAAQRDRLPNPAPLNRGFSIWSVLKSAIGKDLTRITLPATINEPLSALQRIAEDLEYRSILDKALHCEDAGMRSLLVAAFVASGYSATLKRESKPFNPLLGETFEWQSADQSCKFFCEQVSHHPPVSCWWSESTEGWQYFGEMELRSKFWGKSVEMLPTGTCWLKLGQELWSWNKANMSINNIIIGTYWLDWYGKITLHNHTTGESTVLNFPKSSGRQLDQRGIVQCSATSKTGAQIHLTGKYTENLTVMDSSQTVLEEVFRINPPVEQGALQYNMTRLAMTLNTAERDLFRQLPPTDSRFRPDQRALEDAELEKATSEKLRLEERQRQVRKERKEAGQAFFPSWFKLREATAQQQQGADLWLGSQLVRLPNEKPPCLWEFTGEYWACKARQDWARCPDIYSGGPDNLPSPYDTSVRGGF